MVRSTLFRFCWFIFVGVGGQNADSEGPTYFYDKLFLKSFFTIKYANTTKTLKQASTQFDQRKSLTLQISSKPKIQDDTPTNFDKIRVQNVRKWAFLDEIWSKFLSWRLSF